MQLILAGGLVIQLITCFTAIGFYHPDQHFSTENSRPWQLGKESGVSYVWELIIVCAPPSRSICSQLIILFAPSLESRTLSVQLTILRVILSL